MKFFFCCNRITEPSKLFYKTTLSNMDSFKATDGFDIIVLIVLLSRKNV